MKLHSFPCCTFCKLSMPCIQCCNQKIADAAAYAVRQISALLSAFMLCTSERPTARRGAQ